MNLFTSWGTSSFSRRTVLRGVVNNGGSTFDSNIHIHILNVLNNMKCQYLSFLGVYSIMLNSSTVIIWLLTHEVGDMEGSVYGLIWSAALQLPWKTNSMSLWAEIWSKNLLNIRQECINCSPATSLTAIIKVTNHKIRVTMRFSLLWDVTFQDNILIPSKDQVLHKESLLSWHTTSLHCATSQKSESLHYHATEAWNVIMFLKVQHQRAVSQRVSVFLFIC